jgi:polyisoprenoid-binding protein YceI
MKKWMILSLVALVANTLWAGTPKMYVIHDHDAKIEWTGRKVVGSAHTGTVKLQQGFLTEENGVLTGGQFIIDMTSMTNTDIEKPEGKAKLIGHLQNEDFFHVEKYPTALLKIKTITKSTEPGKGTHFIKGDLTIKGITHEIGFYANIKKKDTGYTASADFSVDRSKFDVRYGSDSFFDNLGDKAIKNDIDFRITLTAGH